MPEKCPFCGSDMKFWGSYIRDVCAENPSPYKEEKYNCPNCGLVYWNSITGQWLRS